ncbi:MAG: hypothetical protein BGO78_13465 [Chloroflexi bacterium 44-23]|nr:MAG: hypothetical protein BGO78_13465 [Chloroflexi bacterium 44-23]
MLGATVGFNFNLAIIIVIFVLLLNACQPLAKELIPVTSENGFSVYLPLLMNAGEIITSPPDNLPIVHLPFQQTNDYTKDYFSQMAIFWFGKVEINTNYYDVRIGYGPDALYLYIATFDRLLWYDKTPSADELPDWDSISLYINPASSNQLVANQAAKFVASLAPFELSRDRYQAAYRWNGTQWVRGNYAFTTIADWRGEAMNDPDDDRGWNISFKIPFSSLGIFQQPLENNIWRMAITGHDRDYLNGDTIPPQNWPAAFSESEATNWGSLSFGLLPNGTINGTSQGNLIIQEGLNGTIVQDASPGGFTVCGDNLNFWTQWGEKVYTPTDNYTAVVQNQRDIADWPCYSKYFLAFPISSIPANTAILSAKLKLHLYGNSGKWNDPVFHPYRSLIQVSRSGGGWNENSLNWNNAPQLLENISQTWVDPIETFSGWPGVPYEWDVATALRKAIQDNESMLYLALYSADGAYHSGKYFSTSEVEDWNAAARPALIVNYGTP